jgi:D-beta-D-heptose 7-phosphate kinase/D-beta-D-heptose 1-phosphate adenosyltransferase
VRYLNEVAVVGDAFLDEDWIGSVDRLCPDAPVPVLEAVTELQRPGGAGLAALTVADLGATVTLVTALGDDPPGHRVRGELGRAGVKLVDLGLHGSTPTKLRLRTDGQSLARVDRNCTPVASVGEWTVAATAAVTGAGSVLISDYGRGIAGVPALSALLQQLSRRKPVVWDPHPRGPLPSPGVPDLLTPNLAEARYLAGASGTAPSPSDVLAMTVGLTRRFDCPVVVTIGERGAVLAELGREPVVVPVQPAVGDTCGAGDRFAAATAVARARRVSRREAVRRGVEVARHHVAGDGRGARPESGDGRVDRADALALARRVRQHGGIVVAAGGCFDVLHAGHVELLEAARRLGDCLVVCLNSDRSLRRLKGPRRPVNPQADRVAVLDGLACVDAVLVFDDDTPGEALTRLRPHLFVKGADHADRALPERDVLAVWGGRVVFLPLREGGSTSRIIRDCAAQTEHVGLRGAVPG